VTATIRSIEVGDLAISIAETGEGGRPLLMQHGFTGAKEDFADWWDLLAERGWHVVAPDLRGHGGSDHPKGRGEYSLALFESDMVGLVDALGWVRFTLVGHSLGGMISQAVAIDHPQRLDALVLMDTIPGPVPIEEGGLRLAAFRLATKVGGMGVMAYFVRKPPQGSPESVRRLYAERPGYVEFLQTKVRNASRDMALAMIRELTERPDRTEELRGVSLPTLVLAGEHDLAGFLDGSRRMAEAMDGARLVVLAGAAHSPQVETPDIWWEALTTFLDDLPVSAG
jgi:pimeloyl-ACP methyl ester carboxylesterase